MSTDQQPERRTHMDRRAAAQHYQDQARIAELEAALRPFADCQVIERIERIGLVDMALHDGISVSTYRQARAALARKP